jgi:glucose-1-phosphate thymidylyltransferase
MSVPAVRAVILAGGRGSRMQRPDPGAPLDAAQAAAAGGGIKGMIPDARGRPLLDHILAGLADAGVTDVCLVVGPGAGAIRDHYAAHPPQRVRLAWALQPEPLGTAHALLAAEAWTAGDAFLVLNADNLYPAAALRALVALGAPGLVAFEADGLAAEGNIPPERVAAFAVVTLAADGTLATIEEKPEAVPDVGPPPLVSMNLWRFDRRIFAACRDVPRSARGEWELPGAVALAVARGVPFHAVRLRAGVLDLSHRRDVAGVAERLARIEITP